MIAAAGGYPKLVEQLFSDEYLTIIYALGAIQNTCPHSRKQPPIRARSHLSGRAVNLGSPYFLAALSPLTLLRAPPQLQATS